MKKVIEQQEAQQLLMYAICLRSTFQSVIQNILIKHHMSQVE